MDQSEKNIKNERDENIIAMIRETFKEEGYELLGELEAALLDLERAPQDQELIGKAFRALHTIKGSGSACGLADVSSFAHEIEGFFDLVRKGKVSITKEIIDLTISARDKIKSLFDACCCGGTADDKKGRELILSFKKLIPEDDGAASASGRKEETATSSPAPQKNLSEKRISGPDTNGEDGKFASIRVSTDKLDGLVNLVGELVTLQARLSQTVLSHADPELRLIAEQVEWLTGELRDAAMNLRMMPLGAIFSKFKRVVRDLSRELGKDIELTTDGAETELDKTVIERLSDPLIHLIRNSVDHGIEPPADREAAGKSRRRTVRLSGVHSGAFVLIRISDDGAGLDREAIRAKAVEKGLLQPDSAPADRELFSLIFAPGFSTAKKVTDVSGRGVGLDVVKKTIDALRGAIELNSRKGIGTTITLRLPLTLAIIDGLLVKIGREFFVLPLSFVRECVELTAEDKKNSHGRNLASIREEIAPYINLRERFLIDGAPPAVEQIVIAEANGMGVSFVVDAVIDGHQTVIKSLGRFNRDVEGISGATILGDGAVALIIDVPTLVHLAERDEYQVMKG